MSRAERKQRRKDKIAAYRQQIKDAFTVEMEKFQYRFEDAIKEGREYEPEPDEIQAVQLAHVQCTHDLALKFPQEKELIIDAHKEFLTEFRTLADNIRKEQENKEAYEEAQV